jgi:uncharacterized phage-associated protein
MTTSAGRVADEIRKRIPGAGAAKIHKLLYYAQGHHLADLDEPLFDDTISAWDMGPVVGTLWYAERHNLPRTEEAAPLTEAELNSIGYVVSRYGGLTGSDLIRLSHSEPPWLHANAHRSPGMSVRMEVGAIHDHFKRLADEDEDELLLDAALLQKFLAAADREHASTPAERPDSTEEIAARMAALSA